MVDELLEIGIRGARCKNPAKFVELRLNPDQRDRLMMDETGLSVHVTSAMIGSPVANRAPMRVQLISLTLYTIGV
ncbi:MAG: hypothetical protein H0W33_00200 [Gammaproteobacteria bacterium]|nr:hypothetical protein [Gammaproteobacteria bacterium]